MWSRVFIIQNCIRLHQTWHGTSDLITGCIWFMHQRTWILLKTKGEILATLKLVGVLPLISVGPEFHPQCAKSPHYVEMNHQDLVWGVSNQRDAAWSRRPEFSFCLHTDILCHLEQVTSTTACLNLLMCKRGVMILAHYCQVFWDLQIKSLTYYNAAIGIAQIYITNSFSRTQSECLEVLSVAVPICTNFLTWECMLLQLPSPAFAQQ